MVWTTAFQATLVSIVFLTNGNLSLVLFSLSEQDREEQRHPGSEVYRREKGHVCSFAKAKVNNDNSSRASAKLSLIFGLGDGLGTD